MLDEGAILNISLELNSMMSLPKIDFDFLKALNETFELNLIIQAIKYSPAYPLTVAVLEIIDLKAILFRSSMLYHQEAKIRRLLK